MKKILIALVAALLVAAAPLAQTGTYEQLTVSSTAVPITAATTTGMAGCLVRVQDAQVRFRFDGTVPTASVGTPLEVGDVFTFTNIAQARAARFIRTATDAKLNVNCWPS